MPGGITPRNETVPGLTLPKEPMFPSTSRHRRPASSWKNRLNPARGKGRAVTDRGDEGVSLVEVMVALVILMVIMVPIGYLLTSATSAAVQARQHQAAQQLADSWVEILSNANPPLISDG